MSHIRRGIEPVIVTVILIAVAVALAIAIAFWAGGLVSSSGRLKRLSIENIYATYEPALNEWTIHVNGKNTGSDTVSIVEVSINGRPYTSMSAQLSITLPYTIYSGEEFTFDIELPKNTLFSHGQTIEIALTIDNGVIFKQNIKLP